MLEENYRSRFLRIVLAATMLTLTSTAMAQSPTGSRYPISEGDIAKELGALGVTVDASQVHLATHMSAASATPKLEILSAQTLGNNQVRLEVRCPTVGECLPFLATMDVKDANLVSAEIRFKTGSTTAASHQTESHDGLQVNQELRATPVSAAMESRPKLGVGSHAVLEIREGLMDIHLQVLAIDTGAMGQQVRVCTLDHKKVFHATVTGEGTVTGVME